MTHRLTVLAGPTAVGKGTVVAQLCARYPQVWKSVSATTRPARPGEADGDDYFFVSPAQFTAMVERDEFLEWAVVHRNHRYGTPRRPVEAALATGRAALLEIDLDGARQVKMTMPEALFVFLAPPNWEALEDRLTYRGTESAEEIARRLQTASIEMAAADEFDVTIVNEDVESAAEELAAVMGLTSARI